MKLKSWLFATFILGKVFLSIGCGTNPSGEIRESFWADIDLSEFQALPRVADLNWDNIQPAEELTYWEIRGLQAVSAGDITAAVGEKCALAQDQVMCILAFDDLRPTEGVIGPNCHPPACPSFYIVSNDGNINRVLDTVDELKSFLGNVDSKEEAILLTYGIGFHWVENKKEEGAIRELEGEYLLVALKEISGCTPVQINRYLISIGFDGEYQILREQILFREENACL